MTSSSVVAGYKATRVSPAVEDAEDLGEFRDLAPTVYRQRLIIEGTSPYAITAEQISRYLSELSRVCDMTLLLEPVTHYSPRYGWAGWVHWETSGVHFYAWETPTPFFSVDIYACKPFDPGRAVAFTRGFFVATEIVAKEV